MFDMSQVMILDGGQSRSITGENKEGKKGAGGQASGELGKGRKGSPCTSLLTGETTVLADIEGPGIIQHIFLRLHMHYVHQNRRYCSMQRLLYVSELR